MASSVTISATFGSSGCVGAGVFAVRLDCGHLAILYTNFHFGNLPTFVAIHGLDSFLQVHVTLAEDVLLDVGVHQASDELEPRDGLGE